MRICLKHSPLHHRSMRCDCHAGLKTTQSYSWSRSEPWGYFSSTYAVCLCIACERPTEKAMAINDGVIRKLGQRNPLQLCLHRQALATQIEKKNKFLRTQRKWFLYGDLRHHVMSLRQRYFDVIWCFWKHSTTHAAHPLSPLARRTISFNAIASSSSSSWPWHTKNFWSRRRFQFNNQCFEIKHFAFLET